MGRTSKEDLLHYQSLPDEIYRTNDGRYFIKSQSNVNCSQCNENYIQPKSKLGKVIKCEKCGGVNTISVNGKSLVNATIAAKENSVKIIKNKFKEEFFTPEDELEINKEIYEKAKSEKNLSDFLRYCSFRKYVDIYENQDNLPKEQQLMVLQISIERNIKQRLDYYQNMKNYKQIEQSTPSTEKTSEEYEDIIKNLNQEIDGLRTELSTFRTKNDIYTEEIRNLNGILKSDEKRHNQTVEARSQIIEIQQKQYLLIIEILQRIYNKLTKKKKGKK